MNSEYQTPHPDPHLLAENEYRTLTFSVNIANWQIWQAIQYLRSLNFCFE